MVRGGGIDLAWVIYDSQHFGTAQRRRRLFLVCDFGGKRAGEILFVPKSLRRYFEAGGTPQQGLTAFVESSADESGGFVEVLNDQGGSSMTVERFGLSPTLRNQTYGNLPIVAGPLCMGTGQANAGILYDQSPTLTAAHEYPFLVHPQLAGTLCASGAGLSRPAGMRSELDFCVASAGFRYKAASTAGSVGYQEETAPTLVAGQPSGVLKAFSIGAYYSKGMLSDNPAAGIRETDTSRTLDLNGGNPCCQQGGIAVVNAVDCRNLRETAEISGTLQAKTKSGGYSLNYQNPIHIGFCVRRLTPLEAERLMGFPDFWTEYGHDDKPISDTKRYSMLGNSIAVPCVAYIMQGIRDVLLRERR
jgi:site-specific DNA-cytosine methylase